MERWMVGFGTEGRKEGRTEGRTCVTEIEILSDKRDCCRELMDQCKIDKGIDRRLLVLKMKLERWIYRLVADEPNNMALS